MLNLIDRDGLKDRLKWGWPNDKFVHRQIDDMPVTVLVRCSECVHWDKQSGLTVRRCDALSRNTSQNNWCCWAERGK